MNRAPLRRVAARSLRRIQSSDLEALSTVAPTVRLIAATRGKKHDISSMHGLS